MEGSQKKNKKQTGDLVIPMPLERSKQSIAQRYFQDEQRKEDGARYLMGDWHINGEAHIYSPFGGDILVFKNAELRFGEHPYKRGFGKFCFYVEYFDGVSRDDKRDFKKPILHWRSQTITGEVSGRTVIFRVYPYQFERLKKFCKDIKEEDTDAFCGKHKGALYDFDTWYEDDKINK